MAPRSSGRIGTPLALLLLSACASEDPSPHITELVLGQSASSIEIGRTASFTATANYSDGSQVDVTAGVAWSCESPEVADLADGESTPGVMRGVAAGTTKVIASLEALTASTELVVMAPTLVALEIRTEAESFLRGGEYQLRAVATYSNETTEDVTELVAWSSSLPEDVIISDEPGTKGFVRAAYSAEAEVAAVLGEATASFVLNAECDYPASGAIRYGDVMPAVGWNGAYLEDGTQIDFSLADVHCRRDYADIKAVIFVIGAGWCPPCRDYLRIMKSMTPDILAAGGLIVYVEAETASFDPADSTYAYNYVNGLIGQSPGIRAGDLDTLPTSGMFRDAPLVNAFPSALVVRKRDMKIIADQNRGRYILNFPDIVGYPELDWSRPDSPPFLSNCGPGQEEASEPNNNPRYAPAIEVGTFEGGVCDRNPDYFKIDIDGAWRVTLTFTHDVGDLDVFVWDIPSYAPLRVEGEVVGSETNTDDEVIEFSGPATIAVMGKNGASAGYQLTLEAL